MEFTEEEMVTVLTGIGYEVRSEEVPKQHYDHGGGWWENETTLIVYKDGVAIAPDQAGKRWKRAHTRYSHVELIFNNLLKQKLMDDMIAHWTN